MAATAKNAEPYQTDSDGYFSIFVCTIDFAIDFIQKMCLTLLFQNFHTPANCINQIAQSK